MPAKNASSPLMKHYDKIVLVLAVAVLAFSIALFITTKGAAETRRSVFKERLESFRVAHPEVADVQGDLVSTSNLFKRLANPDLVPASPDAGKAGFFVPETRVWCAKSDCRSPISPKDKVCPVCGTEQPGEPKPDVNADTDGDGVPDLWERKFGLNPLDPADAKSDPDGDGFDNLAEYLAGTDPTNGKEHPDVLTMLRLNEIVATPLPIRFQSRGFRLPDNHYRSQFNYVTESTRRDPPSLMVKEGDPLVFNTAKGKVDTGYVFVKMEIKKVERKVEWTTTPQMTEIAYALIKRGKKALTLEEGKAASDSNYKISIDQTLDGSVLTIDGEDDVLTVDGVKFHVKDVDVENSEVVIESEDHGKEVRLTRDRAVITHLKDGRKEKKTGPSGSTPVQEDGKPAGQFKK